jgi:general secretion pathway protein G
MGNELPPLESDGRPIQFGLGALLAATAGFAVLFSLVAALRAVGFFMAVLAAGLLVLVRAGPHRAKLLVLGGQMVVVATLLSMCIISGMLVQGVTPSAAARTQTAIEWLAPSLTRYRINVGRYPSTQEGLRALLRRPGNLPAASVWAGPYLPGPAPGDAWGQPLRYLSPGARNPASYDLWSFGADGVDGTGDEIGNW